MKQYLNEDQKALIMANAREVVETVRLSPLRALGSMAMHVVEKLSGVLASLGPWGALEAEETYELVVCTWRECLGRPELSTSSVYCVRGTLQLAGEWLPDHLLLTIALPPDQKHQYA